MNRRPKLGLIAYEYPPLIGGMATYAQALAEHMHKAGWDVHVFANPKAQSDEYATAHPVLTTDLARDLPTLNRFKMDLWHSINFGYAPLAILKRPFVLTVHGTDFLRPWVWPKLERVPFLWRLGPWMRKEMPRKLLYQNALRKVDQVITCSRFSAQRFHEAYPWCDRPTVIHNGVNPNFIRHAEQARLVVRHPQRLLTVCNLGLANRRKNVDAVIRAMALVGEHLNLEYWIVGDGSARIDLQELARKLGVDHRVHFLGRISEDELIKAYASSSLFVLVPRPEAEDIEGFGIVYLEAAAMGTPSLAGRYGGATEAVAEGRSGFFVDYTDPTAIANALERFFAGHVHFDVNKIRMHALHYTWASLLPQVETIYRRLLPKNKQKNRHALVSTGSLAAPNIRRNKQSTDIAWTNWIQQKPDPVQKPTGGRVLLISYPFPPVGGSPVQRPAKLAKFLPAWGWDVEVLTAAHDRFPWYDETLLADIPADVRVHRIPGYEPACLAEKIVSFLYQLTGREACQNNTDGPGGQGCQPGRRIIDSLYWRLSGLTNRIGQGNGESLWTVPAVQQATRLHRRQPFDAIVSTGPPHFTHLVARRIARQTGLPWIAELRDPLISDFDRDAAHSQDTQQQKRLERTVLKNADTVITTCRSLKDDLLQKYPQRAPHTVHTITNGFDRDDIRPLALKDHLRKEKEFTFIAAGAFYGRREITHLVKPLQQVLKQNPQWRNHVRMKIVGTLDTQQRKQWEHQKPNWLEFTGYLDHASTLEEITQSHCSILVVPDCRHSKLSVPGKTFELLALPTHVLVLAPAGSPTEQLVQAVDGVMVTPFENHEQTTRAMEKIIRAHFDGHLSAQRNWPALDQYDRCALAGHYASCLAQTTEHSSAETSLEYMDDHKEHSLPFTDAPTQQTELVGV